MKFAAPALILALGLVGTVQAHQSFSIPAGYTENTLNLFALQADITLAFNFRHLAGIRTNAVQGEMDITTAVHQLLAGTGLRFERLTPRAGIVIPQPRHSTPVSGAINFHIPPGRAIDTLNVWAKQAGLQINFNYYRMLDLNTPPIEGELDPGAALARMIAGMPFHLKSIADRHWVVLPDDELDDDSPQIAPNMWAHPRSSSAASAAGKPPCPCASDDGIHLGPWCDDGQSIQYAPSCR